MAARQHAALNRPLELIDLRRVSARDLDPLLSEEVESWRTELRWDFEKSADLVRRFVDLRALNGSVLTEHGKAVGYLYYVIEDAKGLIGDLYVCREYRSAENELRLLTAGLQAILTNPPVVRIESQLMMLGSDSKRNLPRMDCLSLFDRNFMVCDMDGLALGEGKVRRPMYVERWSDLYHEPAAQLIASAYAGHIDSRINDQYRTTAGARRFLHNIVQYPGCGTFYRPASCAAFEATTGRMCGVSLASLVAPEAGHITQICVSPAVRGTGIGYAMLRQSILAFREMGCDSVSLTVTADNSDAVRLYERVGFRTVRRFSAYVWEGF
jgi:ribosomal protein S18 acetylase RimI-like enzyme